MILITYTGLDWAFFLIPFITLIIEAIFFSIFGIDMKTYMAYYLAIGIVLSSIICWVIGKKVNKEKIVSYDDETGKPIIEKNIHKLWGMPVQYFSIVLLHLWLLCFYLVSQCKNIKLM